MITENLSTLKIHKLTQEQYDRELEAGRIDESALYLTPEEEIDLSGYATVAELNGKLDKSGGTITGSLWTKGNIHIGGAVSSGNNEALLQSNGGSFVITQTGDTGSQKSRFHFGDESTSPPAWWYTTNGGTIWTGGKLYGLYNLSDLRAELPQSGTWIPTLVSGADSLTGFSNGTYHKTGNIVTVSILCWGTFTNRNSDPIVISLPFKVASTRSYGQFGYSNINNATLAHQYVYAGQGNTCCELKYRGSSGQEVALTGTDVGKDNWTFQFSLTYATDE